MPNQHEVALLGGATSLLEAGVSIVVITLGARGIKIVTSEGELQIPPFAVRAIDTTGAGDAACGALATALAHGSDITTAARRASAAGALAATKKAQFLRYPLKMILTRSSTESFHFERNATAAHSPYSIRSHSYSGSRACATCS